MRLNVHIIHLLCLLMCFITISCASVPDISKSRSARIIKDVPFFPQEQFQCGPASLAGVLQYWGLPVLPEEIAEEVFSKSAGGTLTIDMVIYPRGKGFSVNQYRGNLNDIEEHIERGHPLIVLVDYGFWSIKQYHFMIIVGYDEGGLIAHSGKEPQKYIQQKDFLVSWEKTENWTLLIMPEG